MVLEMSAMMMQMEMVGQLRSWGGGEVRSTGGLLVNLGGGGGVKRAS